MNIIKTLASCMLLYLVIALITMGMNESTCLEHGYLHTRTTITLNGYCIFPTTHDRPRLKSIKELKQEERE